MYGRTCPVSRQKFVSPGESECLQTGVTLFSYADPMRKLAGVLRNIILVAVRNFQRSQCYAYLMNHKTFLNNLAVY